MKTMFIVMLFLLIVPATVLAQESVEQYLLEMKEPSKEDYINLLYQGSQENKLLALTKLMEMKVKGEEVVEACIFGLEQGTIFVLRQSGKVINDFWDVRAKSAQALGEIKDPTALPHLYRALRYDPDPFVRSQVAVAIGKIGQRESVSELIRTIETSSTTGQDDIVIRACVEALGKIGDKQGFVPLIEVIRGKYSRSIRIAARDALKKIRW